MSVAGSRAGSTMATTGAASIPMPKPVDACRQAARKITTAIAAYSAPVTRRRLWRP
jgi:hypothetical protein